MRPLRLVLAVAILACALPAQALAASATIVAVESPDVVRQAKNPNDDIVRCRMYWGKTATVRGLVTRDDGAPAAGVTLTLFRQFADPTDPSGYKTVPVGQPLVTDAQGRWERKVKPDRITYYYVSAAAAARARHRGADRLAAGRPDDRPAPPADVGRTPEGRELQGHGPGADGRRAVVRAHRRGAAEGHDGRAQGHDAAERGRHVHASSCGTTRTARTATGCPTARCRSTPRG